MKKVLFFVAAIATLGLSSCQKEWNCECTILGTKITNKTDKMSKKDAKASCEDNTNGMCKLK